METEKVIIQVPQHLLRKIIGKNQAYIKRLKSEFGVQAKFHTSEEDPEAQTTCALEIEGPRDKVILAKDDIDDIIKATDKIIIEVPQHLVGKIIGKNGANIKRLNSEFGVQAKFDTSEEESQTKTCPLEIVGPRDYVKQAKDEIDDIIKATEKTIVEELLVPKDTTGRIVGTGGKNVKEMKEISGANIRMEVYDCFSPKNYSLGEQRRIILSGTPGQVKGARELINAVVDRLHDLKLAHGENTPQQSKSRLDHGNKGVTISIWQTEYLQSQLLFPRRCSTLLMIE